MEILKGQINLFSLMSEKVTSEKNNNARET